MYVERPMTMQEIIDAKDEDNFVSGVVSMDLGFIMENDFESFLDEISERLVGSVALMDINYDLVGILNGELLFQVTGDVTDVLEDEDEDEDEEEAGD